MKIAFILIEFPELSETFILDQITYLLDQGHDVKIFAQSLSKGDKIHSDVFKYELMKRAYFFNIPKNKLIRILKAIWLCVSNLLRGKFRVISSINVLSYGWEAVSLGMIYRIIPFLSESFDVVHCHFGPNGSIGVLLKKMGIKGKIITTFHGFDITLLPNIFGYKIYDSLFRYGDVFTSNTNFTRSRMIKCGCNTERIIILPVGLQIERFKFSKRILHDNEAIRILTIARLTEKKGHEYVIKAVERIVKNGKKVLYTIAGEGLLRRKLEILVETLKMNDYIHFVGPIDKDEALAFYQQAHIFVLASVTAQNGDMEGQGLVLQEAQATGLPVISTLHNGIPEGVIDGKSGFLVPEKDVSSLVGKMEYLINSPGIWAEMGKCGREFVEKKYNSKRLNSQLIEIYRKDF